MGVTTIEWTATYHPDGRVLPGFTFNPWIGCAEESAACEDCYARTVTFVNFQRSKGIELWGKRARRHRTKTWGNLHKWNKQAIKEKVRYKVFIASLADIMEDEPLLPQREEMNEWRAELYPMFEDSFMLDLLLLTKRPQNYRKLIPGHWLTRWPAHIWAGTTVEENKVSWRISEVLKSGAKIIFLSVEPMIGPLDISPWIPTNEKKLICADCRTYHPPGIADKCPHCGAEGELYPNPHKQSQISWVIVGGESGGSPRPMEESWVRDLRDQCQAAGIKFFMKQGSAANWSDYTNFDSFPQDLQIREQPETKF